MLTKLIFGKPRAKGKIFFARLAVIFSSAALVFSGLAPVAGAQTLQGVTYAPVSLTSPTNVSLSVQIKALGFSGGKWTYQVTWNRTLDRQGSIYVSPKLDKTALVPLSVDGANIPRAGQMTLQLDPSTRYRLEVYTRPQAGGNLFLRKFFNTLDVSGNPVSSSTAIGGTSSTGGVNNPTPTPSGNNPTPTPSLTPTPVSNPAQPILMRMRDNTNYPMGLRQAPEPLLVMYNAKIDSSGGVTTNNPELGRDRPRTDRGEPENGNREIWVFGTVGRKFEAAISYVNYGVMCADIGTSMTIQRNLQLPPGLSYSQKCQPTNPPTINIDGTVTGSPTVSGTYLAEFLTTRQTPSGSIVGKTRFRFIILKANKFSAAVTDSGGTQVSSASIGGRSNIAWNQTNNQKGAAYFDSVDIWAAPASGNVGKHPDFVTGKQLIATVSGNYVGCNNSTRGGNDPLQYGCGTYNWLVGNTLGQNLAAGNYIIYVTPWLPIIDKDGTAIGQLYQNCGAVNDPLTGGLIFSSNCYGYSYGAAQVSLTGSSSNLPSSNPGAYVDPSFLKGGLKYTVSSAAGVLKSGSVGQGQGSNTDQAGCDGNWTGGVDCGITISASAGQSLKLDWSSVDAQGRPAGSSWSSQVFVSGPFDAGNEAIVSQIKNCTGVITPGGYGPNPSEGFMSSQSGSKTFTIPDCLSGKTLYFQYDTWFYGCGNVTGVSNLDASSNTSVLLQNGQTSCQLATKAGSLIVVNVNLSQNQGEITSNSCRLPAQIANVSCSKLSDSSYQVSFQPLDSNSIPQVLTLYAGDNQSEVQSNCQYPTHCLTPNGDQRRTFALSTDNINKPFVVNGAQTGKTYYNRLVAQCGAGGNAETRETTVTCSLDSNSATSGGSNDPFNTSTCVLPADLATAVAPNCTTGVDVTGNDIGYSMGVKSYMTTFQDIRYSGAKFDRVTFLADPSASNVASGCAQGPCMVNRDVNLTRPPASLQNPNRFNEQYVSNLQANTTYTNRLIYWCGSKYKDVTWTCATER